ISEVVGPRRTVGAVIEIASMLVEPGLVRRHIPPQRSWFAVGSIDPATHDRLGDVADILSPAGTVEVVEDIRSTKWMKLVTNCAALVIPAVLGQPVLEATGAFEAREVMLRAGEEALALGARLG